MSFTPHYTVRSSEGAFSYGVITLGGGGGEGPRLMTKI